MLDWDSFVVTGTGRVIAALPVEVVGTLRVPFCLDWMMSFEV
jgi:hypothetical protein